MGHDASRRPCEQRALVAGYGTSLILFTWALIERVPYDDSYFFKRIAANWLRHGALAWNPEEGPVHGLTSQSFGLLAVAVTAVARDHYVVTTRGVLVLCLIAAYALLVRITAAHDRGASSSFAFASPVLAFTALSGMETALAVLLLAALLWVLHAEGAPRHWTLAPVLLLLVYATRPDAVLLALPPLIVAHRGERRTRLIRQLLLVVAGLGAIGVTCRLYYGSALPLPFYAKSAAFSAYGPHFQELSERAKLVRVGLFATVALPLAGLAAMKRDRINAVLLGSVALHCAFHVVSTIDVMGMHGRFYAPALPLLVVAAARGFAAHALRPARPGVALGLLAAWSLAVLLLWRCAALPRPGDSGPDGVPAALAVSTVAATVLLFVAFGTWRRSLRTACVWASLVGTCAAVLIARPLRAWPALDDEAYLERHTAGVTSFRGMDALRACLGDAIHVYHSEIGVTGLRFANGRVTDLVGLLSPHWLFRRASFDVLCQTERPEAIFLPHASYRDLNREIAASDCLRGYARVVARSSSPLFVRRDQLERYRRCEPRAE